MSNSNKIRVRVAAVLLTIATATPALAHGPQAHAKAKSEVKTERSVEAHHQSTADVVRGAIRSERQPAQDRSYGTTTWRFRF